MKKSSFFVFLFFLFFLKNVFANFIEGHVPSKFGTAIDLVTVNVNKNLIAVYRKNSNKAVIEFYIPSDLDRSVKNIELSQTPVFLTQDIKTNLLIWADFTGMWTASTISKKLEIVDSKKMPNFQIIGSAINVGGNYYFGGRDINGRPYVERHDEKLKKIIPIFYEGKEDGEAIVLESTNDAFVLVNKELGGGVIYKISKENKLLRISEIDGSAAHAVSFDGGFIVVYSKNKSVYASLINAKGDNVWRTELFKRKKSNALRFRVYADGGDFSIAGYNDSKFNLLTINARGDIVGHNYFEVGSPESDGVYGVLESKTDFYIFGSAISMSNDKSGRGFFYLNKRFKNNIK